MAAHHCILTAKVLLSKVMLMYGLVWGANAVSILSERRSTSTLFAKALNKKVKDKAPWGRCRLQSL